MAEQSQPRKTDIDQEMARDYLLEQLQEMRWNLADLDERLSVDTEVPSSMFEAVAQQIYRIEERLTARIATKAP